MRLLRRSFKDMSAAESLADKSDLKSTKNRAFCRHRPFKALISLKKWGSKSLLCSPMFPGSICGFCPEEFWDAGCCGPWGIYIDQGACIVQFWTHALALQWAPADTVVWQRQSCSTYHICTPISSDCRHGPLFISDLCYVHSLGSGRTWETFGTSCAVSWD